MPRLTKHRFAYQLIRIIYLFVPSNRGIHYDLSTEVSQGHCELRMQDAYFNSIGALTENRQFARRIKTRQNSAKRQLGQGASRLHSGIQVGLVAVNIVSIILLRGSG